MGVNGTLVLTIYAYDLYSPEHYVLDACISITRRSGRGLGPGIREFFGHVKWHRVDRQVTFGLWAQKTRVFVSKLFHV